MPPPEHIPRRRWILGGLKQPTGLYSSIMPLTYHLGASRLLFNHKINLLTASEGSLDNQSQLLRENVRHIVQLFPDVPQKEVYFWDDNDCQRGLERLQMEENEALSLDFAREQAFTRASKASFEPGGHGEVGHLSPGHDLRAGRLLLRHRRPVKPLLMKQDPKGSINRHYK